MASENVTAEPMESGEDKPKVEAKESNRRVYLPELRAMNQIVGILEDLTKPEAHRVMCWLNERKEQENQASAKEVAQGIAEKMKDMFLNMWPGVQCGCDDCEAKRKAAQEN